MADLSAQMPRAGLDYQKTFGQLQDLVGTDEAGFKYLAKLRWPEGFVIPHGE